MTDEDSEIVNKVIGLFIGEREKREKFLGSIIELQKTQLRHLEHELKKLSNIVTPTGPDPRIKMLEQSVESTKQGIKTMTNQLEIVRIVVPKIKKGEALVHGRITDESGHGIKNLVVALLVEEKTLDIKAISDVSGYYSLVLPPAIVDKIKQVKAFVYIYSGTVLVYKSTEPINLAGQETKYEIVLTKDELDTISVQKKVDKEARKVRKK